MTAILGMHVHYTEYNIKTGTILLICQDEDFSWTQTAIFAFVEKQVDFCYTDRVPMEWI